MGNVSSCPVCESAETRAFLLREGVPVFQNLVLESQDAAVNIPRGTLEMAVCHTCGYVFNQAFDLSKVDYSANYDNEQAHSPFFRRYRNNLVRHLIEERGVRNCRVVEVGCGNGALLRELVGHAEAGNTGHGFDPAYKGPATEFDGRLEFHQSYYGPECASIPADVVICRHVIEHVPKPRTLIRTIRQALANSPGARVFFETPCVEWILRNQVIWDFFYEHCSLFTAPSLGLTFELEGFKVHRIDHVFGNQYLSLEATLASEPLTTTPDSGEIPGLAGAYGQEEARLKEAWRGKLRRWAADSPLAIWGAAGKGVTFAYLADPHRQHVDCVVDLNPNKQGRFLPGTGHPIVHPAALKERGVRRAVLMNPNYRDENRAILRELGLDIELVE